jgi:hypothetical protein
MQKIGGGLAINCNALMETPMKMKMLMIVIMKS